MEGTKQVNVYMTGFGAFGGVTDNPTTEIIKDIDMTPLESVEGFTITLKSKEALSVDIDTCKDAVSKLKMLILEEGSGENVHNLIIHLGVHAGSSTIKLEKQAVNCANFGTPDVKGNNPYREAINSTCDIDHKHQCKIDIDSICNALQSGGHKCSDSYSAGKYICNYIYYTSLTELKDVENCHSVFIHVPLFDVIKKEDQIACIHEFIKQWTTQLS